MGEEQVQTPEIETKITRSVAGASSEQPRVKDPRRVEAGRRLGAISKAAKEKKARERYDREAAIAREERVRWTPPLAVLGAVGLIGLCYVLYRKRQNKVHPSVDVETSSQGKVDTPPTSPEPPGKSRKKRGVTSRLVTRFDSFGDDE